MRTWEVTLDAGNGTQIIHVVEAGNWDTMGDGIRLFSRQDDGMDDEIAFYPYSRLVGVRPAPKVKP